MKTFFLLVSALIIVNTNLNAQCLSGDCANGVGTFKYANGDMYTGEWIDTIKEGHGRYDWSDGSYYLGYFKNDKLEGQGIYKGIDGEVLEGLFANGELVPTEGCKSGDCVTGTGEYHFANGDTYSGEWVDGDRTGYGRYDWADGSYYLGYFKNNLLHGEGSYYGSNGSSKIGKFQNNMFVEVTTIETIEEDNSGLDDLVKEMDEQNARDEVAKGEAIATATKKDFCSTMQAAVAAYPSNFESLLGLKQEGYMDFGNSWYANLMVENSLVATVSGSLLSTQRSYYNVLFESDDYATAKVKYDYFVELMNGCNTGCCTMVYDTNNFEGESYQSYLTYWMVFIVGDNYDASYQDMVIEVEMMSNVFGPKWSVIFRIYKLEE